MSDNFYPIVSALVANILAQVLKPFFHYLKTGEKNLSMIFESGGFPSSHTALVIGLTLALGYQSGFSSQYFFISLVFSLTVIYDAANVRYYAGQNIKITKQLIQDIEVLTQTTLENPIYRQKIKEVLGHKWVEVVGGFLLGFITASLLYFMRIPS
ncbi:MULTISPECIES: divergent PAP2 family protein [Erysipelothrix]|uniref:Divergent PAP2 family protein n=1 Tax=Erysipelothrix piscisicarius TaxID=2485784 RepID=A0A3S5HJZ9_9FIRM|nr:MULTISPECIES: divergent PAP2 family protein [Erysipelothrix]AZK43581.1 divergent PAP2 family protein [Erysipelothrix piscisicarius]MBK2402691.1 divergent PAP2 family protein [Erysipelothrix sp. strain 2 (EsS2-6-Brazil)]MBK2403578.1 divergent PAP2 family protein [Erysipelothrix sp. strain 2 (EsS2-7-Brazil)]NBA02039.1 divergent PAP2 family protein [Erysipelothrix rhusiopathiae]